ncbi:MAG: hypothetical protein ACE5HJ_03780 [Thermoplasmata archaeon]
MQHEYGKAVIRERTRPRHLAELANYLRMEYGPATGPGYFMAEMANGSRRPRRRRRGVLKRALRALSGAVRTSVPGNNKRPRSKSPEPTR